MRVPFHDLDRGLANVWGDIQRAQRRAIDRSRYLAGPEVEAFEGEWSSTVGGDVATVAVASGTAALAIALRACGIGENDPVYVPAYGCPATLAAVHQVGAWPVFVDVGVDGSCGVAEFARHAETSVKPAAVIPVHLYGRAVNVATIKAWSLQLPVRCVVVEDACQAHGVAGAGRYSDAAAWSFYPTKPLGAWGDAGALTSPRREVLEAARELRDYGRPGSWEISRWGWNARMAEQQAAVLREKLRRVFRRHTRQRARAWELYAAQLDRDVMPWGVGGLIDWNHHLVPVLMDDRDKVSTRLRGLGVQTAVHYPVVLPDLGPDPIGAATDFPQSRRWATRELSLPMFPGIRDSEIAWVCTALERVRADVAAAREGATA